MKQKILVIDDEKKSRDFISELIIAVLPDSEITQTKHPFTALELIADNDYDMIFTDIQMPQMDGISLIREIKAKGKEPFVVMISAYDKFEYAQAAMEHGASGYLLKPFSKDRVKQVIDIYNEKRTVPPDNIILLNKSTGKHPIRISDIVAVEKTDRLMLTVYGSSFPATRSRGTLAGFAEQLPSYFIYANRQCIINQHAIQCFNPKTREITLSSHAGEVSYVCSRENIKQIAALFEAKM